MLTGVKVHSTIPTLAITNMSQAHKFYTSLGFVKNWEWPEGTPTHASYQLQEQSIMFSIQNTPDLIHKADIYFIVSGVRTLHKYYTEEGLPISELIETDYGMIDFSLNDPWGHHLVFGEAATTI